MKNFRHTQQSNMFKRLLVDFIKVLKALFSNNKIKEAMKLWQQQSQVAKLIYF